MSHRVSQFAGIIRTLVATLALRIPPDVSMAPTITSVKVSADLSYADIYVTAMAAPEKAVKFLAGLKGEMRRELAGKLRSHRVPMLRFHVDTESEKASKLEKLLESL